MFIIWGSKGREFEIKTGHFYCPQCDQERGYKHIRVAKYFTLYFIPLFETEDLGSFIKCQICAGTFKTEVLSYEPPTPYQRLLTAVQSEVQTGTSLQLARSKLIAGGGDVAKIDKSIEGIIAEGAPHCDACNLTYLPSIKKCTSCNSVMSRKIKTMQEFGGPQSLTAPAAMAALPAPATDPETVELYLKQFVLQSILNGEEQKSLAEKMQAKGALNGDTQKINGLIDGVLNGLAGGPELQAVLTPFEHNRFKDKSAELKIAVNQLYADIKANLIAGGDSASENTNEWVMRELKVSRELAGRIVAHAAAAV